jgi:activator of HSP90 ATPase
VEGFVGTRLDLKLPSDSSDFSPSVFARRDLAFRLTALFSSAAIAGTAFASDPEHGSAPRPLGEEISRSAEAIHMQVNFNATTARVYDALTDAKQFNKVVQLSAAMKSMGLNNKPVEMSREPGGAFSAFGGYVSGRQLELVAGQRIVQAWRAGSWDSGQYSIARFELSAEGSRTKLVFDHTGFPQGQADHLLAGWKGNYWEPLEKFLAQSQ